MMAREEVWVWTPSPSKQSLSDSRSSLQSFSGVDPLGDAHPEGASLSTASSLERNEVTTPELKVSRHSHYITQSTEEFSAPSSRVIRAQEHPASPSQIPESQATMPQFQGLETPPASESEDSLSLDSKSTSAEPSALSNGGLPTPGPSPDMSPVSDSLLDGHPGAIGELTPENAIVTTQERPTGEASAANQDQASLLGTKNGNGNSSQSGILREPTFDDFLNLSDDDIAEEQSQNKDSPDGQTQTVFPTHVSLIPRVRAASSLTLPSPFPSCPATVAAIEAARIAGRHNFDLIYIVNLWPEKGNGSDPQSTPTMWPRRAPASKDRMKGRFLAAYGLSTVKSPFRISTMVHKRILRTDGWIEYRNDDANADDFACGYACAFYQGQYSGPHTSGWPIGPTAAPKSMGRNIDRGIVFAAYRKPSRDSNKSGIHCDQSQLSSVYRDAEALVEMLVDTHTANQLRNPGAQTPYSDETGPLPVNNPMRASWC
ncbi:hypothetical protein VUR80DRAFT_6503 [Thermomyces stellatus]